jgi:phosphoglycerate dehydrogenase-like enzyme
MSKVSVFSCEHEFIFQKFLSLTSKYEECFIHASAPRDLTEKRFRISGSDTVLQFFDSTPICELSLQDIKSPKKIVVAGPVGNSVDLSAAKKLGISIFDTPSLAADSVAEYTISSILSICHQYDENVLSVRNGFWPYNFRQDFAEMTLGIIGFGHIGQKVATLAQAFGAKVYIWCSGFHLYQLRNFT